MLVPPRYSVAFVGSDYPIPSLAEASKGRRGAVLLHAQVGPSEGQEVGGLGVCDHGGFASGEVCEQSLCLGESLGGHGDRFGTGGFHHRLQHLSEGGLDVERTALVPTDVGGIDQHLVGNLLVEGLAEDGDEHSQCIAGLEVHEDGVLDETVRVLGLDPHGVLVLAGVEPAFQCCHDVPPSTYEESVIAPHSFGK